MTYGRVNVGGGKKTEIEIINKNIVLPMNEIVNIFTIDSKMIVTNLVADLNNKYSISMDTSANTSLIYLNDTIIVNDYIPNILDFYIVKSDNKYIYSITYNLKTPTRKIGTVSVSSDKIIFKIKSPYKESFANSNFTKYTSY